MHHWHCSARRPHYAAIPPDERVTSVHPIPLSGVQRPAIAALLAIVALVVVDACENNTGPGAVGTVRVTAVTTGGGVDLNGYLIHFDDDSVNYNIPGDGTFARSRSHGDAAMVSTVTGASGGPSVTVVSCTKRVK